MAQRGKGSGWGKERSWRWSSKCSEAEVLAERLKALSEAAEAAQQAKTDLLIQHQLGKQQPWHFVHPKDRMQPFTPDQLPHQAV